ncbi:hypothetical protein STEG23_029614 [Scotinomys teguina]
MAERSVAAHPEAFFAHKVQQMGRFCKHSTDISAFQHRSLFGRRSGERQARGTGKGRSLTTGSRSTRSTWSACAAPARLLSLCPPMQDTGDPDSAAAGRGLGIPAAARALWRPEIYGSSSCVLDYPAEGRQRPVRGVAIDVLATQDVRGELELEAAEEALLASELMEFVEDENLWIASRLIWFDQPRPPDSSQTAPVKIGPSS